MSLGLAAILIPFMACRFSCQLGYPPEEVRNLDFQKILPPEYLQQAQERTQLMMQGKPVQQPWELEILRPDSQKTWAQVYTKPVYDSGGTLMKVYGIARNIQGKKAPDDLKNGISAEQSQSEVPIPTGVVF